MASFGDFLQDREDEQAAAPLQAGAPAGAAAPVGGTAPAPAAPATPAPAAPAPTGGAPSRFRVFQDTYTANDTAAQNTANQLAAPIQQAGQKAQAGLSGLQQTFGQAVTAGTPLQGPVQTVTPYQPPAAPAPAPQPDLAKQGAAEAAQKDDDAGRTPDYNDVHDTVRRNRARLGLGGGAAPPKQAAPAPAPVAAPAPVNTLATTFGGAVPASEGAAPRQQGTYTHTALPAISADEARRRAALAYTGPAGITDDARFAQVAKQTADAQAQLKALGTTGGRQALLQQQQAGRTYSPGAANLDALLTGRASGDFQGLRRTFGDLGANLNKAVSDSQAMAGGARDDVARMAKAYGDEATDFDRNRPVAPVAAAKPVYQASTPDPVWQANHVDDMGTDEDRQNTSNIKKIEDAMDVGVGALLPGFGALKQLFGGRRS